MLFNSLPFLFFFLPITYGVFWKLRTKRQRYLWLTASGYVFYGFWNWKFCGLMALSTTVAFSAGLGFARWTDPRRRRWCLIVPIVADLGLLAFFKYANFLAGSFLSLAALVHHPVDWTPWSIVLPIGISFYTFHTITYVVDCYRGVIQPTTDFFEFSSYVSLFAQLVAGPIVRFRQIEKDLENIDRVDRDQLLPIGWSFFVIGMVKKVLVADTIAGFINPALDGSTTPPTLSMWLCILGYSYQLYFDFSGYSDMAVGLGYLFGLKLPQNFDSPYKACNPSDFWRRWHISLSSMLRDYLYIPLGGNRRSPLRVEANLLITMLLGGLWHGANWTFVVWGGYHGLLLAAYRRWGRRWDELPALSRRMGTFLLVVIGWVFFRARDLATAGSWLHALFVPARGAWPAGAGPLAGVVLVAAVVAHRAPNSWQLRHQWRPAIVALLVLGFFVCMLAMYVGKQSPFLYFQF